MINFEDLKKEWSHQKDVESPKNGASVIIKKVLHMRNQQQILVAILGLTTIILIGFFFYVSAYTERNATIGLFSMILILVVRIGAELWSIHYLRTLNSALSNRVFSENMVRYYKKRRVLHFVITPILITIYSFGFLILMPYFKAGLSAGFYLYIQISSIVILLVLSFFIAKQIVKELNIIKELQRKLTDMNEAVG